MIRLTAFVSPNSRPTSVATRSNSAIATRPQLSPPTIKSVAASRSSFFMRWTSCPSGVQGLSSQCRGSRRRCQIFVQSLYAVGMPESGSLRIGELARRTGVPTELLRAWERRYGLLAPARTAAGYRLYSASDVRRVGRMRELLADGLSAAEAARAALGEPTLGARETPPASAAQDLR